MCGGGMHLESLLARCYLASSSSSLAVLPVRVPRKFDHIRRPFATLASPSSCLLLPVLALARPIPRNTGPKHRKLCNSLARSRSPLAKPRADTQRRLLSIARWRTTRVVWLRFASHEMPASCSSGWTQADRPPNSRRDRPPLTLKSPFVLFRHRRKFLRPLSVCSASLSRAACFFFFCVLRLSLPSCYSVSQSRFTSLLVHAHITVTATKTKNQNLLRSFCIYLHLLSTTRSSNHYLSPSAACDFIDLLCSL